MLTPEMQPISLFISASVYNERKAGAQVLISSKGLKRIMLSVTKLDALT